MSTLLEGELAALENKVAASTYLTNLISKYPELVQFLNIDFLSAEDKLEIELLKVGEQLTLFDLQADFSEIEAQFIRCKAHFAFIWSLIEFTQKSDFSKRGEWQTQFAELTIDLALKVAWLQVSNKHKVLKGLLETHDNVMPGLFVFGMGKLGGADLNFSSDVDLVAYFDPEILPVPDTLGKSYICHLVLQSLTLLLGQNGRTSFIWRVDWRLRPNASATTLAMSSVAAREYYFFQASPWHRLALMKARVVAGDKAAGKTFLNSITPFIWRQNLDYRALDELAEIKHRINLEHPALRAQRQWREPINAEIGGFNVKLGSGGIREIEFIANALQLIWGGKRYRLRTPNTLQAIAELKALGMLQAPLADDLTAAYKRLRKTENAIQIMGNLQTHLIPVDRQAQEKLLTLLSENDWDHFVEKLNHHRELVSAHFETLFADQEIELTEMPEWPANLSAPALDIVEQWENGFIQYGVSIDVRSRLKGLSVALAEYLNTAVRLDDNAIDASTTVLRVHDFFRSLPQGEQYFRLLAESPRLLESIIPPLLYSPAMSTLLKQSPHIIDCYMEQQQTVTDGDIEFYFDSEFVLQAERYEIRLERLRRFVNEQLYQLYLQFLQGQLSVETFQLALSELAEQTLELALRIVADNMEFAEPPITVLGMGKIAMRRMSPLSDLDLIFIFDQQKITLTDASKFVARLQTAISAPMREGIVYELDTRLRPSGRSGAPIVSIESFEAHQMQRAHTWEHIALVPSRVVAGDRSLEARIMQVKQQVLTKPRDPSQFINDAAKMWNRVSEHRVKSLDSNIMFSKLRPGGLMQSEYLAACLILFNEFTAQTSSDCDLPARSMNFDDLLGECDDTDQELIQIIQFWRIQQLWERLLGFTEQPVDKLDSSYLGRLLSQSGVSSTAELLSKKQLYSEKIVHRMQALFADVTQNEVDLDAWLETKVQWLGEDD